MKKEIGLWIDHRQAIIVTLFNEQESIKHVRSEVEKYVRISNAENDSKEDRQEKEDRRFDSYLSKYYTDIIAQLQDADSILIFGPGEAKGELRKQLEAQSFAHPIVASETSDNLTEGQVVAKVHAYFKNKRV